MKASLSRTHLLREVRKMRFEEAYEGWQERRLTQEEAGRLLGMSERNFRRYAGRYEADGCNSKTAGAKTPNQARPSGDTRSRVSKIAFGNN